MSENIFVRFLQVNDSVTYLQQDGDTVNVEEVTAEEIEFPLADSIFTKPDSVDLLTEEDVNIYKPKQENSIIENIEVVNPYYVDSEYINHYFNSIPGKPIYEINNPKIKLFETTEVNGEIQPLLRNFENKDWLGGIFLLLIIAILLIRKLSNKFFQLLFDSMFNFRLSAKMYDNRNILLRRVSLVLDIISLIVFSILIYLAIKHFELVKGFEYKNYLLAIILGISIFYALFRYIILSFTGYLFQIKEIFSEYLHHTFVINKISALILLPLLIIFIYIVPDIKEYILYLAVIVFFASVIVKAGWGLKIINKKDVGIFYLILYLCTLEILPLLLGYGVIKSMTMSY